MKNNLFIVTGVITLKDGFNLIEDEMILAINCDGEEIL